MKRYVWLGLTIFLLLPSAGCRTLQNPAIERPEAGASFLAADPKIYIECRCGSILVSCYSSKTCEGCCASFEKWQRSQKPDPNTTTN